MILAEEVFCREATARSPAHRRDSALGRARRVEDADRLLDRPPAVRHRLLPCNIEVAALAARYRWACAQLTGEPGGGARRIRRLAIPAKIPSSSTAPACAVWVVLCQPGRDRLLASLSH